VYPQHAGQSKGGHAIHQPGKASEATPTYQEKVVNIGQDKGDDLDGDAGKALTNMKNSKVQNAASSE
jgi:hypothetical protein